MWRLSATVKHWVHRRLSSTVAHSHRRLFGACSISLSAMVLASTPPVPSTANPQQSSTLRLPPNESGVPSTPAGGGSIEGGGSRRERPSYVSPPRESPIPFDKKDS